MSKELEALDHLRKGVQYINQDESPAFISQYEEDIDIVEQKFSQLEEIEEGLDIDLIILFKALKEQMSIYYIDGDNIVEFKCFCNEYAYHYKNADFKYKSLNIYTDVCHLEKKLYFKDYGKTWALSRKELEKKL